MDIGSSSGGHWIVKRVLYYSLDNEIKRKLTDTGFNWIFLDIGIE
jgi:hypothetical protein